MALGDIWRAATTVRTFNDPTPGAEKFFEWVIVTHYQTDAGAESDEVAALGIHVHQSNILLFATDFFGGNTRIVNLKAVNLTSSFVKESVVNLFIGGSAIFCLPAQVAVGIYGRGDALGRRAMKFYGSPNADLLGADGVLLSNAGFDALEGLAFSPVIGFIDGVYIAIIFGAGETPEAVPITRTMRSPSWRTQRRRVLTMT